MSVRTSDSKPTSTERLSKVIDPELGRSVTDLGMIAAIEAAPASSDAALTTSPCTLS